LPRLTALYHFFFPDDVISARLFTDLCVAAKANGWDVEALPCNRSCRDADLTFSTSDIFHGVSIRRIWRPPLRQGGLFGRFLNSLWMIAAWSATLIKQRHLPNDVIVVGTDPVFSILICSFVKAFHPQAHIIHWCHDMYPEAAIADGLLSNDSPIVRAFRQILGRSYSQCTVIADLGQCMRERLIEYCPYAYYKTMPPWALWEPEVLPVCDQLERKALFGNAQIAVLYSGSFGRAHRFEEFNAIAKIMLNDGLEMRYCARGNAIKSLEESVSKASRNIKIGDFASETDMPKRIAAADIIAVSMNPEWKGIVVPSKFFGGLAAGRPILFSGHFESEPARMIRKFGLGWHLTEDNLNDVANDIRLTFSDPARIRRMRENCFSTYKEHFSKSVALCKWVNLLNEISSTK
jgi:colanic acid biosynthesis glycosyl transferase WcaI